MAFTYIATRDSDEQWFARAVEENVEPTAFVFYFLRPPQSFDMCRKMLSALGLAVLRRKFRWSNQSGPTERTWSVFVTWLV